VDSGIISSNKNRQYFVERCATSNSPAPQPNPIPMTWNALDVFVKSSDRQKSRLKTEQCANGGSTVEQRPPMGRNDIKSWKDSQTH